GDVTAPSIFGSIIPSGPIYGRIQTTGLRLDPITGQATAVPADLGRWYVVQTAVGPLRATTTVGGEGLYTITVTGQIISRGGRIAVRGDILSNLQITVVIDARGALVVGGKIGDATVGTALYVSRVEGIVAATGDIRMTLPVDLSHALFFRANIGTGNPNAAAINAIF